MHFPPMQKVLGITTASFSQWAPMFALAALILLVMEIFKLAKRAGGRDVSAL